MLKEIADIKELEAVLERGDAEVFCVYNRVSARDTSSAIKVATVHDHTVDEGAYVAVPTGSFKKKQVRQVVQVTLD